MTMRDVVIALSLPADLVQRIKDAGPIDNGITVPRSNSEHARLFEQSLSLTDKNFAPQGDQPMHLLTLAGKEALIAYLGTSPNSGKTASILEVLWNALHQELVIPHEAPLLAVTQGEIASAFTEWDRRYREEPERFMAEARRLLTTTVEDYGQACAPYLLAIIEEHRAEARAAAARTIAELTAGAPSTEAQS
jgi:hypothetical protein